MNVQKLYEVCEQLKETSSRKGKESIINNYKDDELFQSTIRFLFDNTITTGIDIKKINTQVTTYCCVNDFNNLPDLLDYIKVNNTGTFKDIYVVQKSIECISNKDVNIVSFLNEIVTKSLRLGIDVKTINKVYGYEFIKTFDVQLGTPIDKCSIPEGIEIFLTQKLNGVRCVYYNGKLYSRNGKEYKGCQHIIDDIHIMFNYLQIPERVLDGELLLKDSELTDSEAFQKGTGIANSDKENKDELKLVIFDTIEVFDFENKYCSKKYANRHAEVNTYQEVINLKCLQNIETVTMFYNGTDHSQIWKWLEYAEQNDMEGIMINLNTPYEFKRTKNLIKVKAYKDCSLKCIAINIADKGKYKNILGSITCKYKDWTVDVGSGFNEEQRKYYTQHPNDIVGKIVEIKYKEPTKNKLGEESLQFPVFLCVREDKYEADVW